MQQLESRFTKLLQLVRYDTSTQRKQTDINQLIANIKVGHRREHSGFDLLRGGGTARLLYVCPCVKTRYTYSGLISALDPSAEFFIHFRLAK